MCVDLKTGPFFSPSVSFPVTCFIKMLICSCCIKVTKEKQETDWRQRERTDCVQSNLVGSWVEHERFSLFFSVNPSTHTDTRPHTHLQSGQHYYYTHLQRKTHIKHTHRTFRDVIRDTSLLYIVNVFSYRFDLHSCIRSLRTEMGSLACDNKLLLTDQQIWCKNNNDKVIFSPPVIWLQIKNFHNFDPIYKILNYSVNSHPMTVAFDFLHHLKFLFLLQHMNNQTQTSVKLTECLNSILSWSKSSQNKYLHEVFNIRISLKSLNDDTTQHNRNLMTAVFQSYQH